MWRGRTESQVRNTGFTGFNLISGRSGLGRGREELCDVDPSKLLLESVNRHFSGNFSCIGLNMAGSSNMSDHVHLEVARY